MTQSSLLFLRSAAAGALALALTLAPLSVAAEVAAARPVAGPPTRANADALKRLEFTNAELAEIDHYAQDGSIDLWKGARESAA